MVVHTGVTFVEIRTRTIIHPPILLHVYKNVCFICILVIHKAPNYVHFQFLGIFLGIIIPIKTQLQHVDACMFICVKSVMQMWLLCVLAALAPTKDKPSLREVQTQAQVQSWETELCVGGLAFGWLPGSPANPQPEPGFQQLPVRFAFRGEICQLQTQRRCMMQISEIKSKNNDNYSETLWEIFKST